MTAKKSDGRRQQQISKSAKHVRRRSGRRRSASTQKHESASLAHQLLPPQRTRAATLPTRLHGARDADAVGGTVNQGRAMTQAATSNGTGGSGTHQDAETGYQWSKQEDQPGFEWKNTRAREEEARALDNIVDKSNMVRCEYVLFGCQQVC